VERWLAAASGLVIGAGPVPAPAQDMSLDDPSIESFRLPPAESNPANPSIDIRVRSCDASEDDFVIVVCRNRIQAPDRLDAEVLEATRLASAEGPPPSPLSAAMEKKCDPTSLQGCGTASPFQLSAIAITAIEATILALKGDDWREALPDSPPNAYEVYQTNSRRPR